MITYCPKPDEIYDYERYTNPNYILDPSNNTDSENINIDNNKLDEVNDDFKFVL